MGYREDLSISPITAEDTHASPVLSTAGCSTLCETGRSLGDTEPAAAKACNSVGVHAADHPLYPAGPLAPCPPCDGDVQNATVMCRAPAGCKQQPPQTDKYYASSMDAAPVPSLPVPVYDGGGHSLLAPPSPYQHCGAHSRGKVTILYPEFVNYLVHPEVDSYQDLPKLLEESDPSMPCPPHIQAWIDEEQDNISSPPKQRESVMYTFYTYLLVMAIHGLYQV